MRRSLSLLVLLALGGSALADPGNGEEVTHYNGYTLAADGASLGLLVGGMAAEGPNGRDTAASSALMSVGLFGGFLATPLIHLARGHHERALGSLVMRTGIAMVSTIIAVTTASCSPDELLCGADRIGPGIAVGLVVASLLDSALLTTETVDKSSAGWAPIVAPTAGGVQLGLAASF